MPAEGAEERRPDEGNTPKLPRPGHRTVPARRWSGSVCSRWYVDIDASVLTSALTRSAPGIDGVARNLNEVDLTRRWQTRDVGAGCSNYACPELRGMPPERAVPTATLK